MIFIIILNCSSKFQKE